MHDTSDTYRSIGLVAGGHLLCQCIGIGIGIVGVGKWNLLVRCRHCSEPWQTREENAQKEKKKTYMRVVYCMERKTNLQLATQRRLPKSGCCVDLVAKLVDLLG